jgi:hypothetical protein
VIRKRKAGEDIEAQLAALETQLRAEQAEPADDPGSSVAEPETQGMADDENVASSRLMVLSFFRHLA